MPPGTSHRNQKMKMTLKGSLGFTALYLLIPCVFLCLLAGCTTFRSTATERQRLQGTWEGFLVGGESDGKITMTITGNSLHFHRDTNFWFETTFTLPASTEPQQLHATIKGSSDPTLIGQVVSAIFKIQDGTLTLATNQFAEQEPPKNFETNEEKGMCRHEFRKVQSQKKNTERSREPARSTSTLPLCVTTASGA